MRQGERHLPNEPEEEDQGKKTESQSRSHVYKTKRDASWFSPFRVVTITCKYLLPVDVFEIEMFNEKMIGGHYVGLVQEHFFCQTWCSTLLGRTPSPSWDSRCNSRWGGRRGGWIAVLHGCWHLNSVELSRHRCSVTMFLGCVLALFCMDFCSRCFG